MHSPSSPIPPHLLRLLRKDYFFAGRMPLRIKRHIDHTADVPHDHEFMEISLVIKGRGVHYSATGRRDIEFGDVFIVHPKAWHVYTQYEDLVILNCLLGLELLERDISIVQRQKQLRYLLEEAPNSLERQGILSFRLAPEIAKRCQGHLEAMEQESEESTIFEISQIGHLLLLLVELTRAMEQEEELNTLSTRSLPYVVLECIRLIETKPAYSWTIEELSTLLCFNRHYLMRVFKQHVGISIMSYIHRSRAEMAAALLVESDQPINNIAIQIGWPDPNYFARRFKEYFGMTATEYRIKKREMLQH